MPTIKSKADLRRTLRAKRKALSHEEQRVAAGRLAANIAGMHLFLVSRRIACYLPNDGEIDPGKIMGRIWHMGKTCYLPVLPPPSHDRLWFAKALPGMKMARNRYGILEPVVLPRELVRAEELDLLLMPLVGFDRNGNRLGRGGGFYDRSLLYLHDRLHRKKPRLLGLAHDFQRVETLEPDPWDIPLAGIVTDKAIYLSPDQ